LMPKLPQPGEFVRWRNPRHAKSQWWDETYGPGPFEVVRVVDHSDEDLRHGIIVKTKLGERNVNEVWLALVGTGLSAPSPQSSSIVLTLSTTDAQLRDTVLLLPDEPAGEAAPGA